MLTAIYKSSKRAISSFDIKNFLIAPNDGIKLNIEKMSGSIAMLLLANAFVEQPQNSRMLVTLLIYNIFVPSLFCVKFFT